MYTSGQKTNYDKYHRKLQQLSAPILEEQLPNVLIDYQAMLEYAREKGVRAADLTEEEKNRFISGETVKSLQEKVKDGSKYKNLEEWNEIHMSEEDN